MFRNVFEELQESDLKDNILWEETGSENTSPNTVPFTVKFPVTEATIFRILIDCSGNTEVPERTEENILFKLGASYRDKNTPTGVFK